MTFEYIPEVANDLEKLFISDKDYDVIIYAGENEKRIHAHSLILSARSQYFCAAFSYQWAEKKDGKFIVKKPDISHQIFKMVIR
jgi:hypothetical protein